MTTLLYHGTTHRFQEFKITELNNHTNHVGRGIYMTSCYQDVTENYRGVGSDLWYKIEMMADEIRKDNEEMTYTKAKELAREKCVGCGSFILHCGLRESANFLKLSKTNYIEMYTYKYADDGDEDEHGEYLETEAYLSLIKIIDSIEDSTNNVYSIDSEISTYEIFQILRELCSTGCGEYFKQWVMSMGYNGVEYEDAHIFFPHMVRHNTQHFVAYDPKVAEIIDIIDYTQT